MNKAFTIVELIFVVVILGILAAVAIPKLSSATQSNKNSNAATKIKPLTETICNEYGVMYYKNEISYGYYVYTPVYSQHGTMLCR